ncbi:RNA polymerase sigma factor [Xanthomonas sp. PPL568]|uniref:RNA polymerase sigma factor n=1 Tax=Xanthomonas indica TaxID=2912242 RepID=UPI001F5A74FA|nr:sigma-70 family RNA polymerase sigma factor [Xanthomonas indica]MCI2245515.1 RNA polymerase sigma factor [Xanthomonas indica]
MTFPTDAQAASSDDALRRQLLALAQRWLGHGQDAEDLVQETYLRAAQGPLPASGHDAWLTTVLRHLCIDLLRRRGRYRALLERMAQEHAPPVADAADEPARHALHSAAVAQALATLVRTLPAGDVAMLLLAEAFDFRHAELAALSARSESASRQHLRRLLQRARAALEDARTPATAHPHDDDDACLLALCRHALRHGDPAGLVATLRAARPQTLLASAWSMSASAHAAPNPAPVYAQPLQQQGQLGLLIRNGDGVLTWLPLCELAEAPCLA